jgi:crotonobetainyl-CoA:carnitine CoA-transferase CaiB-like acyl-CoA transferase
MTSLEAGRGAQAPGSVLSGIRVLDFGRFIAGPYCAALLAEHGAEVIRIERRGGGEDRWLQPVAAGGEGTLFLQVNRNKRSMTLDPARPEGREVVRRLVATADVVVANLPPPTLEAMGLDYPSLVAVKPDVILTTTTAYGRGGPYSDRVGFDMVGQAMSGAVYLSGDPGAPRRAMVSWVDFGTAVHAAFGTMLALVSRQQTGKGQVVEGSLLATALSFGNAPLIEQAVLETNRIPTGNRSQTSAPADLFRTRDGWIACQVLGPSQFARWAGLMGEAHWLADPRFADDLSRGEHGQVVSARMSSWCAGRTTARALEELDGASIPAAQVLTPQQALDDPHVRQAGFLEPIDYPGLPRPAPVARAAVSLSATPGAIRSRAPTLGEHTDAILAGLGYGAEQIADLRTRRVV